MHSLSELYTQVGAGSLVGDYQRAKQVLEVMTKQMEQYPNTPYTQKNAETAGAAAKLIREIGDELREWYRLFRSERGA